MIAIIIGLVLGALFVGVAGFRAEAIGKWGSLCSVFAAVGVLTFVAAVAIYPEVNVWQSEMAGKAQLEQATMNRQVKVQEAHADQEAAILLAKAEVERARGVAQANKIVAGGLGGPSGYLQYLYIQAIHAAAKKGATQFVYVPTRGGLPVLEAGRLEAHH